MATNECHKVPRVMLWTCPRSASTAFVRAIVELGTVEVFNEEFSTAYFFGPERGKHNRIYGAPHHTFKWVKDRLEADYPGKAAVFAKEMAYTIVDKADEMLPQGFYHTFLIRDPLKVFPSVKARYQSSRITAAINGTDIKKMVPLEGYSYLEIRDLYNKVKSLGLPTLIMDADDLLEDPVQMCRQYCQLTELPFKESMVKWKPAKAGDLDWHCSKALKCMNLMSGWYKNALGSSGFQKPEPRTIDFDSLSPDTKLAIEVSRPYYEELHAQRMTLSYPDN